METTEIYTYLHTLSLHDALPIHVDASLTLEDAIKWVEGVEVKQRVVGLADGGIKSPAPAGEDMRKLFMKKRLGTPDEIIELIEKKLPEALMLERQLASVIALMPSADPVMVSHRARAAAQAASIDRKSTRLNSSH